MKEKEVLLKKIYYLAAEVFGYSYEHYEEKVKINHIRFTKIMPEVIKILQENESEDYSDTELAKLVNMDINEVKILKENYQRGKEIVNAQHAAESFLISVRESIQNAMEKGLKDESDLDKLMLQLGYCATDFGYLLNQEGKKLKDYSEYLKQEKYL